MPSVYLCVLEVVSPQWSDLILTTDIPNSEANVLVFDRFHIESCNKQRVSHLHEMFPKTQWANVTIRFHS